MKHSPVNGRKLMWATKVTTGENLETHLVQFGLVAQELAMVLREAPKIWEATQHKSLRAVTFQLKGDVYILCMSACHLERTSGHPVV